MKIIPAVDLLDGQAVRLYQGSYDDVKSYSSEPLDMVVQFKKAGTRHLHLVDLDAARWKGDSSSQRRNNREVIKTLVSGNDIEIEVGGGIRNEDDVKELMDLGVRRLIVGTLLVKNPGLVELWAGKYDVDFIAGIDARDGDVIIAGWEDGSSVRDEDLAATVASLGVKGVIYTNISRDGTLNGPDIDSCLRIAEASGLPVTVSGGMGSMEDCAAVAAAAASHRAADGAPMIEAVILGKSLYEGAIDLAEAVLLYQEGL